MQALSLEKYSPEQFNVLVPTQHLQQVSPWHAIRVSEVRANPDPDAGDVYKVGSRRNEETGKWEDLYCPAKPLLMKIAAAAGIVWNWKDSVALACTPDYVCYRAVGAIRLPDGSWQPVVGTKEIDLAVIEEELYEQYLKKAEKLNEEEKKKLGMPIEQWAQKQTRNNMIQWRKNKLMRAETGAMLRVIRAALGMKGQYTKEEIERPFVVPRIDFSPDYSDPAVRQALIQHGIPAMSALFGQVSPQAQPLSAPEAFSRPAIMAPAEYQDDENEIKPVVQTEPEEEKTATGEAKQQDYGLLPWEKGDVITCKGCDCVIEPTGKWTAEQIAEYSREKFGKELCPKCQDEARKAAKKAGGVK